jgi:two-component sensor histidine kinase/Flp pilus assembly protein TadD
MKLLKLYLFFACFTLLTIKPMRAQGTKIDSLLSRLKTDKNDTNKVKDLYRLCNEYRLTGDYETGLTHGKQAVSLARNLKFKRGIASSYNNMGIIYMYQSDFAEAMKCYESALKIYNEDNNNNGAAKAYGNMSGIYMYLGNYPEALKINFAALKMQEQNKDTSGIASRHSNIGQLYLYQKKYTEALNYFRTSLKLYSSVNDKEGMAISLNNSGIAYMNQKNYTEALKNYVGASELYEELQNKNGMASCFNNIGIVYDKLGNYPEALQNYLAGLELNEKTGDEDGIASSFINIGTVYTTLHKPKDAETYLMKGLELSMKNHNIQRIASAYSNLSILDSSLGNYKEAYRHYQRYIIYRDSLNNEETKQKTLQSSMQYDFDKKEAATKIENDKIVFELESQNQLQKQKQLFMIVFIIVFVILMLVLLFFAKRAYDNKKKYSEVLSKENEHKELLLREVHHRVNNSLQMISSLLSIQADTTENDEIREYLLKSENRIHAMSTMHHLLHLGNSKLEVDINTYLGEIVNFYSKVLESKPAIKLIVDIPSINFHTKTALPLALLMNELLTNSIKYAFPNNQGIITISLTKTENDKWIFKLSDNGIGYNEGDIGGKGTSLGLSLVKLMSRQIGGKAIMHHENGTLFELTFSEIVGL